MTSESLITRVGSEVPTVANPNPDVVSRAAVLFDVIREEAPQGQTDRQITPVVQEAMKEARLLDLLVPERLGGAGADVRTMIECLVELGRADGSAGWSAALLNGCTWIASTFSDRAQREMFGEKPGSTACGIFFPGMTRRHELGSGAKAEGGYYLSGEYPFASGNALADWATLGMFVDGPDGEKTMALGLVPSSDWTVKDTWFTLGMRGTGSNTLVLEDAFVPDHRIQRFDKLTTGAFASSHAGNETASNRAVVPIGTLVLAAPAVGLAKAALDYTLEKIPSRGVSYTIYQEARNSPTHKIAVGQAASLIDAAHLLLARAATDIDRYAAAGVQPDDLARARLRMDAGQIYSLCRQAVELLMTANGASAFVESGVLGRIWRDLHVGSRHAFVTSETGKEVYGGLLLGAEEPLTTNI